jgi:hypothetical protein
MKQEYNRRKFIHSAAIAGIGIGLSGSLEKVLTKNRNVLEL